MGYLMAVALAEQAQQMLFLERLFITLEAEAVQDITMVESVELEAAGMVVLQPLGLVAMELLTLVVVEAVAIRAQVTQVDQAL